MAEPNLTITVEECQIEIAFAYGMGRDPTAWSAAQLALIEQINREGARLMYVPPRLPTQTRPHRWSFLRPTTTLVIPADYDTGTIEIKVGTPTKVDLSGTGASFPTWIADGTGVDKLVIAPDTVNEEEVEIVARDSTTKLTIASHAVVAAGTTYLVKRDRYLLTSGMAGIDGDISYDTGGITKVIMNRGEQYLRSIDPEQTEEGDPVYFALYPKLSTGVEGTRFYLWLVPRPEAELTLWFQYRLNPDLFDFVDPATAFPFGATSHHQTMIAACLAAGETKLKGARGPRWDDFLVKLEASIALDLELVPDRLGNNMVRRSARFRQAHGQTAVTVRGILYDGEP